MLKQYLPRRFPEVWLAGLPLVSLASVACGGAAEPVSEEATAPAEIEEGEEVAEAEQTAAAEEAAPAEEVEAANTPADEEAAATEEAASTEEA